MTKWAEQRVSAVKGSPDDEAVAALTSDAKHIASGFPGVVSRILVPAIVARGIGVKEVPMLEQLARELGSSSHEAAKSPGALSLRRRPSGPSRVTRCSSCARSRP